MMMNKTLIKDVKNDVILESLQALLDRVADELTRISGTIEDTQSSITRLTWRHASQDPHYLEAMQKSDLTSQEIAGLANFLRKITEELPNQIKVNAAQARRSFTLSDLAKRMIV